MKVAALWRYPVKSFRGERLERAEVLADGFAGDRLLRVEDERGLMTARRKQKLVGVPASVDAEGEALIEGEPWHSPESAKRLRELAGAEARFAETDAGARFDAHPVLVCTDGALAALGEDPRRFRPNVIVEGVEGLGEREWVGRRLRIGTVELTAAESCERCAVTTIDPDTIEVRPHVLRRVNEELDRVMGIYCEVAVPGSIALGDEVEVI